MDTGFRAGRTISLPSGGADPNPETMGTLTIVHPSELARRIELSGDTLELGRWTENPVGQVSDGTVSRRHLTVGWSDAEKTHTVTDLGSRNGTWLNGLRVDMGPHLLADGAVIRFGGAVAVYERVDRLWKDAPELAKAIPGRSFRMRRLRNQIAAAAPDPSPALVIGSTGAGKEHVVRALHQLSGRKGPFIAVNVTELAPQLAESQLFGHVKGAFTGAIQAQKGLIRAAEGGTLFLDEIGELPLELQPKLLRVIQEREVRPVGGSKPEPFDVRIVAATNRDLGEEVNAGRFRRDLWARLSLWQLSLPSLVERRADLPQWIELLHERWCDERGREEPPLRFSPEAMEKLLLAHWPENLRGVDRLVHRLAVDVSGAPIGQDRVAELLAQTGDPSVDGELHSDETEPMGPAPVPVESAKPRAGARDAKEKRPAPRTAEELSVVLDRMGGSVRAAARWYGRDRRQIYRWLESFGLVRESPERPRRHQHPVAPMSTPVPA